MKKYNKWFSVILAMLIVAFLIVISSWVLSIVVEELKNTRMVFNSIATYEAWAWANEYALLKIKNHSEWFEDKVTSQDNKDYSILDPFVWWPKNKSIYMSYEIENYSTDYTWSIDRWAFDVIPLFFDSWAIMQINSKKPNKWNSNIIKTWDFTLSSTWNYVWNIIWNDTNWTTFWISWSGSSILNWNSTWFMKKVEDDTNMWTWVVKIVYSSWHKISDFLDDYDDTFLVLYNPSSSTDLSYNITSSTWFSLPKIKVIWTWKIWSYVTNLEIKEDKNKYYEALMYSLFNTDN